MLKTRGLGASGIFFIKKCISIIKKSLSKHTKSKNTSCKVNNSFMFKFVLLKPSLLQLIVMIKSTIIHFKQFLIAA